MVYKIPCAECDWCYVGETGRCFETRKKELIRNVKTCASGSNIAKHAWLLDHSIAFDISSVIGKRCFRIRKTLEAWHTSATKHADNNYKPILNQYCSLFKKQSPISIFLLRFCSYHTLSRPFLYIFYSSHIPLFIRQRLKSDSRNSIVFNILAR